MQQPVQIALPRALVCLVNPELLVSLYVPQRLQVGVSSSSARQPCVLRETSGELILAQYFLSISCPRAMRNVCQLSVVN